MEVDIRLEYYLSSCASRVAITRGSQSEVLQGSSRHDARWSHVELPYLRARAGTCALLLQCRSVCRTRTGGGCPGRSGWPRGRGRHAAPRLRGRALRGRGRHRISRLVTLVFVYPRTKAQGILSRRRFGCRCRRHPVELCTWWTTLAAALLTPAHEVQRHAAVPPLQPHAEGVVGAGHRQRRQQRAAAHGGVR